MSTTLHLTTQEKEFLIRQLEIAFDIADDMLIEDLVYVVSDTEPSVVDATKRQIRDNLNNKIKERDLTLKLLIQLGFDITPLLTRYYR